MIFSVIVMAILAKILHSKGYTMEKMLPFLLVAGIIAYLIPVGSIIALPFKIIGGVFGLIGVVFGVVFGAIGLVIGIIAFVLIPLFIIAVIVKLVR